MIRIGLSLLCVSGLFYSSASMACEGKAIHFKDTYNSSWYNTCANEYMNGDINYHRVLKCNPVDGGFDLSYKYNYQSQMIGQNSGTKYIAKYEYKYDSFYQYPIYDFDRSYYLRYVPTGSGNNVDKFTVRYDCSYRINYETGDYDVDCSNTTSCD